MTPKVNALALRVACDDCGAGVAHECIGARGRPIKGTHWVRRRAASDFRKRNTEEREARP